MDITFGGLATGLDTDAIISALLDVERIPILRAEQRRDELRSRNGVYDNLSTQLESLRTALEGISSRSQLSSFQANSSNEDAVRVQASGTASQGTYEIDVTNLARNRVEASSTVADGSTVVGSGDFDITVDGTTTRISLGASATLDEVAAAVNDADAGVIATVINDGTSTRLTFTAEESGATGFTIDDSSFVGLSGFDLTGSVLEAGQDASFTINGLAVTRSTNEITDLVEGVTFDLREGNGARSTVTVNSDTEGIREKIEGFIEAYNEVAGVISNENAVDAEGNPTGSLFGDSGLRSIQSTLRTALQASTSGTGSFFTTLSTIGIRTDASGRLSLDASDFEDAINSDREGVISLFTDESSGIADRFIDSIESLTNSTTGLIRTRKQGIDARVRAFDDQIERLERRLISFEERLVNQYARLETTVANLQAQGASLTGAFGG